MPAGHAPIARASAVYLQSKFVVVSVLFHHNNDTKKSPRTCSQTRLGHGILSKYM
jgi:hypothetical protein